MRTGDWEEREEKNTYKQHEENNFFPQVKLILSF